MQSIVALVSKDPRIKQLPKSHQPVEQKIDCVKVSKYYFKYKSQHSVILVWLAVVMLAVAKQVRLTEVPWRSYKVFLTSFQPKRKLITTLMTLLLQTEMNLSQYIILRTVQHLQ